MLNPLYHGTGLHNAVKILQTKSFNLTMAVSGSETIHHGRKRKLFFLSTSRIAANQYRSGSYSGSVTLVLNRDWFEQRYQAKPIDYWEGSWKKTKDHISEKEERIFSDTPFIKIPTPSRAIHSIWLYDDLSRKMDSRFNVPMRQLLILAKRNNIPIHFFTDRNAYFRGDTRKTTDLKQLIARLEIEKNPPKPYSRMGKDWTSPWRELFWKQRKKDLSKEATRLAYNLNYHSWNNDQLQSLEADLHNNKNNVFETRKMAAIWKKLKISTVREYHDFIKKKWTAIYDAEKD